MFGRSLHENIFLVEKFSVLYLIGLKPFKSTTTKKLISITKLSLLKNLQSIYSLNYYTFLLNPQNPTNNPPKIQNNPPETYPKPRNLPIPDLLIRQLLILTHLSLQLHWKRQIRPPIMPKSLNNLQIPLNR